MNPMREIVPQQAISSHGLLLPGVMTPYRPSGAAYLRRNQKAVIHAGMLKSPSDSTGVSHPTR
jgi:hypothetical protein